MPTVDGLHTSANGTVLRDVKYTNTATYYSDGKLEAADVLTYEAPAVVARQTVQQTTQSTQPISPTNVDAGKRVALVIGNDRYQSVPIRGNAVRDGKAISSALLELGFEKAVETAGGYGERVSDPAEMPKAMKRAMDAVSKGNQALLNVICSGP